MPKEFRVSLIYFGAELRRLSPGFPIFLRRFLSYRCALSVAEMGLAAIAAYLTDHDSMMSPDSWRDESNGYRRSSWRLL